MNARSEAQAALACLVALARAGDDVLAIGEQPPWLAGVCAVSRTRARACAVEGAFDAIGEHTAALLVREPDAELLEALVELGPPVICLGREAGRAAVTIAPSEAGVALHVDGLAPPHLAALRRALEALSS